MKGLPLFPFLISDILIQRTVSWN